MTAAASTEAVSTKVQDESTDKWGLGALVDKMLPGPGGALDKVSKRIQNSVAHTAQTSVGRPIFTFLHGQEWLGHPAHPLMVAVPIGAWVTSGWYDAKSAATGRSKDEHAADAALRVGIVSAVPAALTGVAQLVEAHGAARREASVHAIGNNVALTAFLASLLLRGTGRRRAARWLSSGALLAVGFTGFLGGDLSYRRGVGVRRQQPQD